MQIIILYTASEVANIKIFKLQSKLTNFPTPLKFMQNPP